MSTATDTLGWNSTVWDNLKQSVHDEARRTKIAQKILPLNGPHPGASNVSRDITADAEPPLTVTEGASISLIETAVPFAMTTTQVHQEEPTIIATTLITRAANLLSRAQDEIIFQGSIKTPQLKKVVEVMQNGNDSKGLVAEGKPIEVEPIGKNGGKEKYGENTFAAVTKGISSLQQNAQFGPYALVLHTDLYSDACAPLEKTLVMPYDRIIPLVERGFHGSGALPEKRGVLCSLGGNTMDLTVGDDSTPEFMFFKGKYQFRVFERFTLRLKTTDAVRTLVFKEKK